MVTHLNPFCPQPPTMPHSTHNNRQNSQNNRHSRGRGRHTNQALYHTRQHCINNYGFSANPNLTLQQNFNLTLQKESNHIKGQPFNSTFHNLCTLHKTPPGTRQLLGLNLKFFLASNKLQNNIPTTLRKMA